MNGSTPNTINGFDLVEQLGIGAFGVVYRATQPQVSREVAIKVILPEYANRPEFVRRFEAEAHIIAQLEHPHIVPLYDFWHENDRTYLVMRLMPGNLKERLASPLRLVEVKRIIEQVGAALAFAHRRGVIHRDLKPANILLDEEGNAYLSDFGIAKDTGVYSDLTSTGVIIGSPGYLSPEQVKSEPVTTQSDIYALGIMLYELLVGEHPFPHASPATLILKHLNDPLPALRERRPDLPFELDTVIRRATAKNTAERYEDAAAFLADFRRAVAAQENATNGSQGPAASETGTATSPAQLNMRFLGGTSIELDNRDYTSILPVKVVGILVYLVVTGTTHSRDALASLFWSDFPEARARSNLRDALATFRSTPLSPFLLVDRRSVAFNPDALIYLDTTAFLRNLNQGRGLSDDLAALESAVSLYRGEFLKGLQINKAALFENWVDDQRRQLHLQVVSALQLLVDYHSEAENYDTALSFAQRLLKLEPWMEKAHRNVMRLLFFKGDYVAALRCFESCQHVLREELDVEPSTETQTLYENIRRRVEQVSVSKNSFSASVPQAGSISVPHNLPGELTPFIGRGKEQRAVELVLKDRTARLFTILGVGGSGKTRLAVTIGAKQARSIERDGNFRFHDGVFFVPLEAVETITEIVPSICRAIGFQPADEERAGHTPEDQFLSYLSGKRMLIILDNFEQLLAGINLLARILNTTAHIYLMVTSRQKLGIQGERLFSLEGLRYPNHERKIADPERLEREYSAPKLFLASARRLKPDFQLRTEEIPALVRLCRLVDGLPLAIELAAGWTDVLPVSSIASEIESELSILESRYADFPDRHRSMKAVFDVSWGQLTPVEQSMFIRLCVFRGGYTQHAAAEVIGIHYRQLAALVSKALVQYDQQHNRYQIHPLLRFFGETKLSENHEIEKDVRNRHSAYYCDLLYQWNQDLISDKQLAGLAEFDNESANARAAWDYAVETGNVRRMDRAADGLLRLYVWRRRFLEGETAARLADEGLTASGSTNPVSEDRSLSEKLLARVKIWRSIFHDRTNAKTLIEQAFAILTAPGLSEVDTRKELAQGYLRAGDLAFGMNSEEARRLYKKSLALYREIEDSWGTARVLTQLGWDAILRGKVDEAHRLGDEALSLVQATGDCKRTADILWMLGTLAILQGDVTESNRLLIESLEIRERLGDRFTDIMTGPLDLGMTLTWIGRFKEADLVRQEALALYEAQGRPEQIAMAHIHLATSKIHIGDFESVESHARFGLSHFLAAGDAHGAGLAYWLLGSWAFRIGNLGEAKELLEKSFEQLCDLEGSFEYGWAQALYAELLRREGNVDLARTYILEALKSASGVLGLITLLFCLSSLINILISEKRYELAVEYKTLLNKHGISSSPSFQWIYGDPLEIARECLSSNALGEAVSRGNQRDFYQTAAEVVAEIGAARN